MKTRANGARWGWVALMVCAAASSCGSDAGSSAGSCGVVAPCGGDPTGTWKYTATCSKVAMAITASVCPTAEVVPGGLVASGTTTFNADKTYAFSFMQTGTVKVNVPASCLMQGGFTLTCDLAATFIQQSLGADSPFTSVTCTGTSGCLCAFGVSTMANEAGTWAVNGTSLTLSAANGGGGQSDAFCIQGSDLHITDFASMMGGAQGTSDVVAVKQ
jgi:hypothetical protein